MDCNISATDTHLQLSYRKDLLTKRRNSSSTFSQVLLSCSVLDRLAIFFDVIITVSAAVAICPARTTPYSFTLAERKQKNEKYNLSSLVIMLL